MARVPNGTLPQQAFKAAVTPTSQVSASAAAFGALTGQAQVNLGNTFEQLGEQGANVINDINKQNLQRNAKYLYADYAEKQRILMHGDGLPGGNPGLMNLQGEAAIQAFPEVQKQLATFRAGLEATTDNAIVKDMFSASANEMDNSALTSALVHVNQQRVVADTDASKAIIWNAQNDGALGWKSPDVVFKNSLLVENETENLIKLKGLDPNSDTGKIMVKEAKAAYYDKVITQAAEEDYKGAQTLFNKYKAEIGGIYGPMLEQKLQAAQAQSVVTAERAENFAHTRLTHAQEANDGVFTAGALTGTLSLPQVAYAAQHQLISAATGRALTTLLSSPAIEGPGDRDLFIKTYNDITDGTVAKNDFINNPGLNNTQKLELVKLGDGLFKEGGPLARADVQFALADIKLALLGEPGIMGYTAEQGIRLKSARDQFLAEISQIPASQLTAPKLAEIQKGVIDHVVTNPGSTIKALTALPPSKYFTGSVVGDKKQLTKQVAYGMNSLNQDHSAGKVTDEEFLAQTGILKQYKDQIERGP